MIDDEREVRKYAMELRKENSDREEGDRLKISIRKRKLFVNNEFVKPKVEIPTAADILTMDQKEINELKDTKVYEGKMHEEAGSEFGVYFQRVKTEDDVQKGYAKMKLKFGDATHIVTAYKLENAVGPYKQAYIDDGEAGAGRVVLNKLKQSETENLAIFVTRYYGGMHMGKRRFEIYAMLAREAIKQFKQKMEKLDRANRMKRSNSQLSQLSSLSQEDQGVNADLEAGEFKDHTDENQ